MSLDLTAQFLVDYEKMRAECEAKGVGETSGATPPADALDPALIEELGARIKQAETRKVAVGIENPEVHLLPTRNAPCTRREDGTVQQGVEITLEFPEARSRFDLHSGKINVRCQPLGLSRSISCAVQSVELLRARDEPALPPSR